MATIWCKEKSKIKMMALTKRGFENIIWFSILSHDHKPEAEIIAGMKRRLEDYKDIGLVQVIRFYDNLNRDRPMIIEIKK